jgi:hypothetical protein
VGACVVAGVGLVVGNLVGAFEVGVAVGRNVGKGVGLGVGPGVGEGVGVVEMTNHARPINHNMSNTISGKIMNHHLFTLLSISL